ncbi:hypothetical protein [Actinoplanes sp. N902-109]|uniref:hypothetical protein n=1 Tax=Actinoplanes sp. (strain N902-109) TaxID=649831 RepID=UPI0005A1F0D6|nr:hypothetical protein [Actinoplanes sp. N902-109]
MTGMLAASVPAQLLRGIGEPGELHTVLGGMPHNVTIEMDLALWRVARGDGDLDVFLRRYGHPARTRRCRHHLPPARRR